MKANITELYWNQLYDPALPPTEQNFPFPPKPKYLTTDNHIFDSYLTTVSYGNNGEYINPNPVTPSFSPTVQGTPLIIEDDKNVYTQEEAYPNLQITTSDISIESVPWEDEYGQLVAKEICRKYNGGGFHDWRLPRASELRAIMILYATNGGDIQSLNFNSNSNINKPYWTGTEVNKDGAWSIRYYNNGGQKKGPKISPLDKKAKASIRCVREVK